MWNLYILFGIFCNVYLSDSLYETYNVLKRYKRSNVDNLLINTSPPTLIKELQHLKFFNQEVVKLKCTISGNPRPLYQWYISTTEVVDLSISMQELQFEKVINGNEYTLEIDGTKSPKKFSKYAYYCVAQSPLGSLLSNKIIVEKVIRPEKVSVKYTQYSVYEGEKFVIQCHASPELWLGLFKFKWWEVRLKAGNILYLNKTEGRYSVITSTKTPELHIRNVSKEDFEKTKVRCIVKSTVHNDSTESMGYFVPVEKVNYEAPSYLSNKCGNPETITASVGSNIELPWCSIPKTLDVTWYKMDISNSKIQVATKPNDHKYKKVSQRYGNLLIINATKEDSGKYMAVSVGKFQPIKLMHTVNIYEPAAVALTPSYVEKMLLEVAEFICIATYSKCQFYWLHNGRKVTSGYDDDNVDVTNHNNQSILRIKKIRLSVTGIYQCIAAADNELKAITEFRQSSSGLFISKVPPILYKQSPRVERDTITAQIQMSNIQKIKTIECIFSANPKPNIDWYLDSKKVPIQSVFSISIQDDSLSIYNFIAKLTINLDELNAGDDIREYAGEYQAVATNILGTASCKTFVLMDGPLDLRLPAKQTAVGGKDFVLTCYFVAMGVPEFSWYRKPAYGVWESMPSNHRTVMRDRNHILLLMNVIKAEDEGTYRCVAKFNRETKNSTTFLKVANPPNLQSLPSRQDISESNFHICTVNNKADKPWYVWWTFTKDNSNETIELKPDYYSISSDFTVKYDTIGSNSRGIAVKGIPTFLYDYANKGVNLRIKERLYEKSALGKFTCHAKNHIGYTEISIEDNFLSLEFKIVPPSTSEVVVGSNLYLNCTAKESDLDPYIKWRIPSGDKYIDINDMKDKYQGRVYQFNNGTLVMTNIRESDPSTMFCFIIPSKKNFEVQSKVAYVDIRVPARVRTMEKEIYKVADTAFNLSCNIYGHTKDLLVTWFHYVNDEWKNLSQTCIYSRENHCINEYQSDSKKFKFIIHPYSLKNHTVYLQFRDVVKSIAGLYKCKAKNKFNKISSESSTNLTIISKPSKIENLEKSSASSTDISFQWEPPRDDGNRPILFYEIQYSELHRNLTKKNTTIITFRVNSTTLFKKFTNLRPYRTYEISIIAVNEVGKSEATLINLTTQEALPERPVRNLKASSTQPHEILITWDEPELQYQNGKIIYYELCYQTMPAIEDSGNIHVSQLTWSEKVKKSDQNSKVNCQKTKESMVSVPNLPQFTDFGIEVIAYNTKGNSPPSYTKVRTLEDLPQASPTNLFCRPMQQTVHLTWNPPGRQTINGVLIGYVVHYYKPNKYGDESDMLSINVQGTTNVILDQLESDTGYSIQVMAANRKGLGPPSARIICTTEEAKPEAPDDAKAVKFNSTCVAVSWLHVTRPHGKIREYCVLWLGYSNDKPKCQIPNLRKRYNFMILCDRFNQNSRLKVFARNRHDGASKEINIKEYNGIISFGGQIDENEGASVLLLCETSIDESLNVVWKKDGRRINNNENPNLKIYSNNSLEIKAIEKYGHHVYSCSTEYDSIEYNLNVLDTPNGLPRPPYINDVRITENSIFISWKSKGTTDISAPITGFSLTWENLYNGESKIISVDGNVRTYYLNNATCASDFIIKIRSINAVGQSDVSNIKKLKTLGTIPQIADTSVLLPLNNIKSNSVYFNLNAFGPGDNCSAIYFSIEISLSSMGHNFFNPTFNKNISIYELENKCCYKVTNLNPLTSYKYQIMAYNPAGTQTSYNIFRTIGINDGNPNSRYITVSTENPLNHSWLLMIILIIAVIFIMVFLVLGVLYIFRNKDQRSQSNAGTMPIRKPEFNQPRVDRPNIHEDTTSMDSNGEPSPYAVYQPDNDPKTNNLWPQQMSQTSSTPGYNYPEHLYNQIRYDKIHQFTRPMTENQDHVRRVNSAECLSSVGNASISGIADLESPSNIDPSNRILQGPYGRSSNNDDVFQNIQIPGCSTVNRQIKRVRRDSENLRYNDEERIKLVHQNPPMVINWRNDPTSYRSQQPLVYNKIGNPNMRIQYRQQMSVPEPMSISAQQHGYTTNRIRTQSGVGSSQAIIPNSASQITPCSNYYETHCSQIYPNAKRDNPNSVINTSSDPFPKYIATNHQSNYAPQQRATGSRPDFKTTNGNVPRSTRNECSDDEIYTDRVVVV